MGIKKVTPGDSLTSEEATTLMDDLRRRCLQGDVALVWLIAPPSWKGQHGFK